MGWRFQKRISLLPGITMNLGKNGSSFSFGPRGAKVTVGKNGIRKTFGIPGTGLSYSTYDKFGGRKGNSSQSSTSASTSAISSRNTLDVGFFSKMFLSGDEKIFIDGIKALLANDISTCKANLSKIPNIPDANFVLAVIYLNEQAYQDCKNALNHIIANIQSLGMLFQKYNLALDLSFPITDVFCVNLSPNALSMDLLRCEVFQHTNDIASACNLLLDWYKRDKTNIIVKISLAELILSADPNNIQWLKTLANMTENIENDSPVHTVLLYYRGVVFKNLKLYDSAQTIFSSLLKRKKDRDTELLLAIQEERARTYELQGNMSAARKVWEAIYAEDSSNVEAAQKLNLSK